MSRRLGSRIALAALLAVLVLTPSPAPAKEPADEDLPPPVQMDRAVEAHRSDVADRHAKLSRWLKGRKRKRSAHRHLLLALRFDPDHRSARLSLGYRKVDGVWVQRRPVDLAKLEDKEGAEDDHLRRDDEILAFRVAALASLADRASELGLPDRAKETWRLVLRLAPGHTAARQALGHRQVRGRWFAPFEADVLPEPVEIERLAQASGIARGLNLSLQGWRSGRFSFESDGQEAEFREVLEAARRADALCSLYLEGRAGPYPVTRFDVHALGQATAFEKYVDQMSGLPPAQKQVAKQTGLVGGYQRCILVGTLRGRSHVQSDWWAHGIGMRWLQAKSTGRVPSWFLSGFTDHVSYRLVGTMMTRFFTVERSAGLQQSAGKSAARVWRRRLRDLAVLEEDPKTGVLFSSSMTGMSSDDVMKAWSLIGFLIERDPAAFVTFAASATSGKSAEGLEKAYGLTPDELDAIWRDRVVLD